MPRSQFEFGTAFTPLLVEAVADALTPKAVRKQRYQQLALEALVRMQPAISTLSQEEKEKFYPHFFSAYGMYEPPRLRKIFGARAEPLLPLPKGSVIVPRGEERPSERGKLIPPRIRVPAPEPWSFPEPVDAAEMRELLKHQKETAIESTKSLIEERKRPRPYAPMTPEEYGKYHGPHAPLVDLEQFAQQEAIRAFYRRKGEKGEKEEKPPRLGVHEIKPLREELLRLYLAGDVWPSEEAKNKALIAARAGLWDDVYYQLNDAQRNTFEQIISMAQPHVPKLGGVQALYQALRELQQQRPQAFQWGGVRPPTTQKTTPPAVRSKEAQTYSQEDLEYTAKIHGMTVDQVKEQLGVK